MIQLHTPSETILVDVLNPTPDDLDALELTRAQFDQIYTKQIQGAQDRARIAELVQVFATCHSSQVIPLPGLTELVILICEYITKSQPR